MPSIFTRIINGEIPCYKIAETETCLAFLDINPLTKGHSLVIPKQEIDYFYDLPDDVLSEVMIFSKQVAKAIQKVIPCERVGVSVIGLEVPHAHVHLIPFNKMPELSFANPKLKFSHEEFTAIANSIASNI